MQCGKVFISSQAALALAGHEVPAGGYPSVPPIHGGSGDVLVLRMPGGEREARAQAEGRRSQRGEAQEAAAVFSSSVK